MLKKVAFIVVALILFAQPVLAVSHCMVKVPRECHQVMSSEFSSGGGDAVYYYYEVFCKRKNGTYKTFLATYTNTAGILGSFAGVGKIAGRMSIPRTIP